MTLINKLLNFLKKIKDKGFFHLYFANILILFSSFATQLFVAKFLTASELADIKVLQSYFNIFMLLAGFGMNTAILKIAAENHSHEELNSIMKQAFNDNLKAILVIIGIITVYNFSFGITAKLRVNYWLYIYLLMLPFSVYVTLIVAYLQARKKIKQIAHLQSISKIAAILIIISLTYFFKFAGFITGTLIGYIITFSIILTKFSWKNLKSKYEASQKNKSRLRKFALFSLMANLLTQLNNQLDIFFLDRMVTDRSMFGTYSLATIFILGLVQFNGTVQTIVTPYFSQKAKDKTFFFKNLLKYQGILILISLFVALASYWIIPVFQTIVYGDKFVNFDEFFHLLLLKYFIQSSFALCGAGLLAIGLMKFNFFIVASSLPINLIFTYNLVQKFGIKGAVYTQIAISSFVLIFYSLLLVYIYKNYQRLVVKQH